jgi:hypothetical protein
VEEPARVRTRRPIAVLTLAAGLLAVGVAGLPGPARAVGEDPAAELTEALRNLGPPGMVWGRLVVEEESPVGTWTPLDGLEVTLYPATPALITELEGIRQSARASSAQYESAVARVQAALAAHRGRIDRQFVPPADDVLVAEPPLLRKPGAAKPGVPPAAQSSPARTTEELSGGTVPSGGAGGQAAAAFRTWRQKTDWAGLFAFDAVPSGDWLVVVSRVSPYGTDKLRSEPKSRQPSRAQRFLPRTTSPAKEAEFWVTRVHVLAGERVGLQLTDRARWLAGPVR